MKPRSKPASTEAVKKKKSPSPARKFTFTLIKLVLIFTVALVCATAGMIGGAIYGYIKTAQPITDEEIAVAFNKTTVIKDSKGNIIDKIEGKDNKDSEPVAYKDVPDHLKHAFIAIEDERFETHPGIDFKRTFTAGLSFITNKGDATHGGSTITQQLVKNITGKEKTSLQRKVQEWYAAIMLERKYEKWQILESYMNIIYMGHSCYGVQSASKKYFGKPVSELSLAECALLAGITNRPGKYDPFTEKGLTEAIKRQKTILKKMLDLGKISLQEYDQAVSQELVFASKEENTKATRVQSYFVDQVIQDVKQALMKQYDISSAMAISMIYNNGLEIQTTMDPDIQQAMDEVFLDDTYFPLVNEKARKYLEHPQAAMVILDAENAQVRAIYGGYGKKEASNTLNRASSPKVKRQPGSSIKPIAVYAPAVDMQLITPATVIDDVPVYMMTTGKDMDKPYPNNFDFGYDGLTSIRNALKNSVNVVAAKLWRDILTPDNSIEYLKRVGIDRENEKYISLALGGLNQGVNPLQMAAAYVPFAHKGMYFEPTTFTKVLDSKGEVLLDRKSEFRTVYSEQTAFLMVDMMKEVCKGQTSPYPHGGTAASIINEKTIGMPVAGKTGTTSSNIDKWFVGYTPYYVAATWYGYDNNIKAIEIKKAEQSQAQKIWAAVMSRIHKKLEKKDFAIPKNIVKKRICIYSGKIASPLCALDPRGDATREEYFIKGTEPREDDPCTLHVQGKVCKDSLDIWKRNLLAGPYCPVTSVTDRVFILRPQPYVPVKPEEKAPKDLIYELPEGEYCNIHGAPSGDQTGTTGGTDGTGADTDPGTTDPGTTPDPGVTPDPAADGVGTESAGDGANTGNAE